MTEEQKEAAPASRGVLRALADRKMITGLVAAIPAVVAVFVVTNKAEIRANDNTGTIIGNLKGDYSQTTTINNNESYEAERERKAASLKSALVTKCDYLLAYAKEPSANFDHMTPSEAFWFPKMRETEIIDYFGQEAYDAIERKMLALQDPLNWLLAQNYISAVDDTKIYDGEGEMVAEAMDLTMKQITEENRTRRAYFLAGATALCNDYRNLTLLP